MFNSRAADSLATLGDGANLATSPMKDAKRKGRARAAEAKRTAALRRTTAEALKGHLSKDEVTCEEDEIVGLLEAAEAGDEAGLFGDDAMERIAEETRDGKTAALVQLGRDLESAHAGAIVFQREKAEPAEEEDDRDGAIKVLASVFAPALALAGHSEVSLAALEEELKVILEGVDLSKTLSQREVSAVLEQVSTGLVAAVGSNVGSAATIATGPEGVETRRGYDCTAMNPNRTVQVLGSYFLQCPSPAIVAISVTPSRLTSPGGADSRRAAETGPTDPRANRSTPAAEAGGEGPGTAGGSAAAPAAAPSATFAAPAGSPRTWPRTGSRRPASTSFRATTRADCSPTRRSRSSTASTRTTSACAARLSVTACRPQILMYFRNFFSISSFVFC